MIRARLAVKFNMINTIDTSGLTNEVWSFPAQTITFFDVIKQAGKSPKFIIKALGSFSIYFWYTEFYTKLETKCERRTEYYFSIIVFEALDLYWTVTKPAKWRVVPARQHVVVGCCAALEKKNTVVVEWPMRTDFIESFMLTPLLL